MPLVDALGQDGRYEILKPLGAGGMGEVFLARDHRLGRSVAIKRMLGPGDASGRKRALHEARALALLNHPHIASVFDVLDADDRINIVMEYVEGPTLAHVVRQGPSTESEVLEIGRQTADALEYAHARGVLHCDIKPSNMVVTPQGGVKVLDFGIAQVESETATTATRTTGRGLRGTPGYMAPELLLGAAPTPSTDLYALGVTLCELATGRRPAGPAPDRALRQASSAAAGAGARMSPALARVVSRAIEADPARRFRTAAELRTELEGVAVHKGADTVPRASSSWMKTGVLGSSLAAACAALLATTGGGHRPPSPAPTPVVVGVFAFNDTGDAANDHLAVGLSDVVVSRLAGASGLTVVPRTAVLPYVGSHTNITAAVRDLGLTHTLSIGVQKSGEILRLTTGLADGRNARVLWSSSMSGPSVGLFELQQRAADAGLRALRAQGLLPPRDAGQGRGWSLTTNEAAFEAYANGRTMLERADVPGNRGRAIEFFKQATARDPAFVAAYAALGDAQWLEYRATRDTTWIAKARASTLEALRIDPGNASVQYSLAVLDHGTGRADDAIADLERALERQPTYDEAYRLLGRIHSERGEFDRAIDAFREAQRLRPDYPATIRALGLAYFDSGRLPEAIAAFSRVTALQPDGAPGFQLLGTAHHAAGELDRALAAYQRANEIAPRATAYSNIGVIHHTRAQYERAASAYRDAIALQPREATTHRNLADALWMLGERRQAAAEYSTAIGLATSELSVNPHQPRVLALVALCEAKLGRIAVARSGIEAAVRQAPQDPEVAYKLAVIDVLAGRLDEARVSLARAVALGYSAARLDADRDLDRLRPLPQLPVGR